MGPLRFSRLRALVLSLCLAQSARCTRAPQPSTTPTVDASAPRPPAPPPSERFTPYPELDATAADAAQDAWEDSGPPIPVRVHPVLESLRAGLLLNATPDLRYTIERVNLDNTDRGDGRAIYYALWDYAIRVMLPAALYRPLDWRWPRTRIVDDATLLSAASQYTDDAFTLDRAPSFDMRCLSDTCPREAERRADCNSRPLDFVRGWMDATVSRLRARNAALADGSVSDGTSNDSSAVDGAGVGATDAQWSDEDYCSAAMTLILELTVLTEARADCRTAQSTSVAMLHAIATTARRRHRPAGTPAPFRDASVAPDGG